MNLLALDTALERCSAAVSHDGGSLVIRSETIGRGHAERLADMISAAMDEAGLAVGELARIAVTVGPGSFTGLRVALAMARGIAVVQPVDLVGITTLAAIAGAVRDAGLDITRESGPDTGPGARALAVALPSRGDDVYVQLFAPDGTPQDGAELCAAADIATRLGEGCALAGSGAPRIAAHRGDLAVVDTSAAPDIAVVARLGHEAVVGATPPSPLYLRAPDAKVSARLPLERA